MPAGRVFTELRCQLREDDQQARCINGAPVVPVPQPSPEPPRWPVVDMPPAIDRADVIVVESSKAGAVM